MNEEVKFSEFLNFSSGDLAARSSTVSFVGLGENAFGVEKNIKFTLNDFISYIGGSINAFSNGGNSFGVDAKLGTNDAFPLYFRTNNTDRGIIHSNGRLVFGGTTDNGFGSDFYGTMAVRDDFRVIKNSVNNIISNKEVANTRYTNIINLGTSGGWRGGVLFSFGVSGGTSQDLMWFNRSGAIALGQNMGSVVEGAAETQFIAKCETTPSGTYAGTKVKLYTNDFTKYTYANSKIMTAFVFGGANGATIPATTGNAPSVSIGWQYHPLTSGFASDMIFLAKDDSSVLTEIIRFCGRDQSIGLGVTEPSDKFHMSGNFRLGTAGNKIKIKSGANASVGTATLVAGTVTVNTTAVSATSMIFLSVSTVGGTQGILSYTKTVGASFTVTSTSASDTSTIDWLIIDTV